MAELDRLSKHFPPGMKYQNAFDTTEAVGESIRDVLTTLLEAIVLVILVIFIFLAGLAQHDYSRGDHSGFADRNLRVRQAAGIFRQHADACSASRWPPDWWWTTPSW